MREACNRFEFRSSLERYGFQGGTAKEAEPLISSTLAGISIVVREVQPLKALFSIISTLAGISIEVRDVQLLKPSTVLSFDPFSIKPDNFSVFAEEIVCTS